MTRDKIQQLAKEAGLPLAYISVNGVLNWDDLARFAALVAAAERDECAKVCDELAEINRRSATDSMWQQGECAAAIRARKPA